MTRSTPDQLGGVNRCAFLDAVAWSELGEGLLAESDDGYDVLVGSLPGRVLRFPDYARHPNALERVNATLWSTAAGRYQFIHATWIDLAARFKLAEFGPLAQDQGAIELVREHQALDLVDGGRVTAAFAACRSVWASLPGAGYGQRENSTSDLVARYTAAGGLVATRRTGKLWQTLRRSRAS